jgi:hypothetical protein
VGKVERLHAVVNPIFARKAAFFDKSYQLTVCAAEMQVPSVGSFNCYRESSVPNRRLFFAAGLGIHG